MPVAGVRNSSGVNPTDIRNCKDGGMIRTGDRNVRAKYEVVSVCGVAAG